MSAYPVATDAEFEACLRIRRTVFVDEQGVPEHEEIDGLDPDCSHFLVWSGSTAEPRDPELAVGTARLWISEDGRAKAQRVAVLAEARGTGVGKSLMRALEHAARRRGVGEMILGAQTAAIPFYERIGYEAYGAEFLDAGIPHRMMRRRLEATA